MYRRFTKKGTWEETETLELRFYTIEDATKCIQAQKINFANQAFRTAPKIMAPLKICRVCKTFNPKHRPGSCTSIRFGKCSGDHASKNHPESVTRLKCPVCSEEHSFNRCPHRQIGSKKALKTAQKSYKEVLLSQARKPTHKVPPPEQIERLLLTPNTKISVTGFLVSS